MPEMSLPTVDHSFAILDHPPLGRPGKSHRRPGPMDRFWYGVCYYPEHWEAPEREDDARLMAEAGFNVARMTEFAWDLIEPEPGVFHFELFDAVIDRLAEHGISTILGTPTAAPPRWLTLQHPEVLGVDTTGRSMHHGSRQHGALSSPVLRAYGQRVVAAMAEHYKDSPHVVAWQIDNEFHCHFRDDYSEAARQSFIAWCRRRYGGEIDRLNHTWGTRFWAQTYRDFEELVLPHDRAPTHLNPAHQLDYVRFLSDAATRFQREQVQILRAANPAWVVFHNGTFSGVDFRGPFVDDLDLLGFDSYPMFQKDPAQRPFVGAFNLDRARSWSGNFIIPEQQSGAGGQPPFMLGSPEPGEMRLLAMQGIAHGADGLIFFRWRSARFGAEQYWLGLIDHDNIPRRRYSEAKVLGQSLKQLGPLLSQTRVAVEAAVASSDMHVRASHDSYPMGLVDPEIVAEAVHQNLMRRGLATGCVHPADDLQGIGLLVIPHWALFDADWVAALQSWVEQGGVLVVGCRTASRDWHNNIVPEPLPGPLAELCGVTVTEYGRIDDPATRSKRVAFDAGGSALASQWYETMELAEGTEAIAQWEGRHLTGQPAITRRAVGKGRAIYVGTYLQGELLDLLLSAAVELAGVQPVLPGKPEDLELVIREKLDGSSRLLFLLNASDEARTAQGLPDGRWVINDGEADANSVRLPPMGVAVLQCDAG